MRRGVRFGWLAVAVLAGGCAVYTSGIARDAPLYPGAAYLYGRSFMKAADQPGSLAGKQSVGLVIRCADGNSYTLGSSDKRDQIQVFEIAPTRCWLMEAVRADQDRIIRKRLPAEPSMQRPLDFSGGRAYYLGDYFAVGSFWSRPGAFVTHLHWQWAMDPADDRYESTTAEMKRAYPNLASLPTVDRRLILGPERKRGNGIVAAPGEAPMSPERLAGVAPFIKRNYAAPAECEAACTAGQCLPYRSESGPVIACVIRCNKNSDCPEGLGCNCPNSEHAAGPDCQPIATTPQDPMARICLSVEAAGERR
jgi:hypothetical protein